MALLEDPDERIYLVVSQVIRLEGTDMLEHLDEVISKGELSELQRFRAADISETIRLEAVRNELKLWKDSHEKDLLKHLRLIQMRIMNF